MRQPVSFTQEDPIGLAGGLNLYGFASGDPVNHSDPFGLCPPKDKNTSDCAWMHEQGLESADPLSYLAGVGEAKLLGGAIVGAVVTGAEKQLGRAALRRGLIKITGEAVEGAEAHHIFPYAFRDRFKKFGIDVNRGEFGAWWEKAAHRSTAREWNTLWDEFLPTAKTREQVLKFGRTLAKRYGLDVHF